MTLTDPKLRNAKSKATPYRLSDGRGLYLLVNPNGGKWWRFDYRFKGVRKTISMGTYPDSTLAQARDQREQARGQVRQGIDPSQARKASKGAALAVDSFQSVAREWHARQLPKWSSSHATRVLRRFEKDLFPYLGSVDIGMITAPQLLKALRRIEDRGAFETAHRVLQSSGQVFRYAIATGRAERDPAADLRGALAPTKPIHHAALTDPRELGALLRALDGYRGEAVTRYALLLAPLVFVRPGELRQAEWEEIDLDSAVWRIPAHKMKLRIDHIVPLSKQSVAILSDLKLLTGVGDYVFPGARSLTRPMSENTVNAALRRLGYSKSQMTGHGFRTIATTLLNEQGWTGDAIERQMSHSERDSVRAAYNRAEHLEERVRMMQAWADYLDGLRTGADVVWINGAVSS